MPLLSDILNNHIHASCFTHIKLKLNLTINIEVTDEEGYYFYYYFSKNYINSFKDKLNILKELDDNIFLQPKMKLAVQKIFYKLQKTYYAFSKLAYIWKFKKSKIAVDNDLSLNPININNKNVFILFQNNARYLFTSNDLINIINNNLSNSPNFFCSPLWTKNPYNNMSFTEADFYNIYFFLKFKVCNVPILLELFFKSNLNLNHFAFHNECVIRSFKIDNFVKFSDNDTLYKNVKRLLTENIDVMNNIKIHYEFPKDLLIKIMKPYLHLYIISQYYILGTMKRTSSENCLRKKLRNFALFNPLFGRKNVKIHKFGELKGKTIVTFNCEHINFYKKYENTTTNNIDDDTSDNDNNSDSDNTSDSDYSHYSNNAADNVNADNVNDVDNTNDNDNSTTSEVIDRPFQTGNIYNENYDFNDDNDSEDSL